MLYITGAELSFLIKIKKLMGSRPLPPRSGGGSGFSQSRAGFCPPSGRLPISFFILMIPCFLFSLKAQAAPRLPGTGKRGAKAAGFGAAFAARKAARPGQRPGLGRRDACQTPPQNLRPFCASGFAGGTKPAFYSYLK